MFLKIWPRKEGRKAGTEDGLKTQSARGLGERTECNDNHGPGSNEEQFDQYTHTLQTLGS